MKALVISPDESLREQLRLALRSVERRTGEPWEFLEARDGFTGLRAAWRYLPDIVVADQIVTNAGAFAIAKELRGQMQPFPGSIIIVLAREQDDWIAKWSGADAIFSRRFDPFELADTVQALIQRRKVAT
jgi:DNA-binding response OmpR family regulator